MNYNKNRICQFEGHEGNPILGFCIQPDCQYRAYCHDCIREYHSQHLDKLKQYKKFDIWLKNQQEFLQDVQNTVDYLHDLENIFTRIKQVYQNLNKNEEMKLSQFNTVIDKLAKLEGFKEIIQSKQSLIKQDYQQNFEKANQFLKTLNQILNPTNQQELEEQNIISAWKNSQMDQLVPESDRWFFQKSSQLIYQSDKFGNFILEPSIPQDKNSVVCLEIQKDTFSYLGVCDQKLASTTDFNKGYYLIGNNGFSYSHSNKEFNCVRKSFTFSDNQVIFIIIDQKQKEIIFEKLDMPFNPNHAHVVETFTMPFDNTLELNYCVFFKGKVRLLTEEDFYVNFEEVKQFKNLKQPNKEGIFTTDQTLPTQQTQYLESQAFRTLCSQVNETAIDETAIDETEDNQ